MYTHYVFVNGTGTTGMANEFKMCVKQLRS